MLLRLAWLLFLPALTQEIDGWPFDAAEALRRQADTAKALALPDPLKVGSLTFRLIPAGKFELGSPKTENGHEGDENASGDAGEATPGHAASNANTGPTMGTTLVTGFFTDQRRNLAQFFPDPDFLARSCSLFYRPKV